MGEYYAIEKADFKEISEEIQQLNSRIQTIQESITDDASLQERLGRIQQIIDERTQNKNTYDDSIVRQMIECIQAHKDGKLTIIFGGGYEIEESIVADNKSSVI